ncbi:MAG: hypothetical protein GOMPHAMPRED_000417 [Gomphillus americanus]|uniref:Major facilitator superfamily (MFS) profile domain-containing protein n=1 Tax=Gomphillus americanus TaxID=1940652 RepID=A0A8H3EE57_9LECA|nr:MAG: hypothetical protein GOMPHAMPRED_000417 [Gomphillus americanus]
MAAVTPLFTPGLTGHESLLQDNTSPSMQQRDAKLVEPSLELSSFHLQDHSIPDVSQSYDRSVSSDVTMRNELVDREHKKYQFHEKSDTEDRNFGSETRSQNRKEYVRPGDIAQEQTRSNEKDLEAGSTRKSDASEDEKKDPNLVDWDGDNDKGNPMNWPFYRKALATGSLAFTTLVITFASSVFSTATEYTAEEFEVSEEVMILGTSLFVLGFAFGPIVWGPLSELYGRRLPLFLGYAVFAIFQIPVAVSTNLETIMLSRYFGGLFGSSALAVIGGALADFWDPVDRGVAICFFAGATFLGPVLGPIIGSFVSQSYLGWRWTAWLTLIMASFFGGISIFLYPESFAPIILQKRAKEQRWETRNWALHAKADENRTNFKDIVERYLARPLLMTIKEPILVLVTIYMALIYGILYLFFEAYPIAFQEVRGWSPGLGSLPFLAIIIGVVIGGSIIVYLTRTRYKRKLEESGGKPVPEERLPAMILGGMFFPIGLFWFAWTSNPAVSWVPQVLAGIPIGAGVLMIFMQGLNYLIDVYMMHANSALAANTFLRSFAGAGFPLFATPMFKNLGVNWAGTVLGCLAVACIPFPVLFYVYGHKIRSMSKYSPAG